MRLLPLAATILSLGAATIASAPAEAAGGCGWGAHPVLFGCRPNYYAPHLVAVPYGYRPIYYPHHYWGYHRWHHGW